MPDEIYFGKTLSQLAYMRMPGRAESQSNHQPQLGSFGEEPQPLILLEPLVVVLQVLRIPLELIFLGGRSQSFGRTRCVISIGPRTVHIGKLL